MDCLLAYRGISPKPNVMTPFTEWIKIDNYPTEFNFRKVHAPNHDKFFITMVDAKRNTVSFDMIMTLEGKWSIIKPVSEVILQIKEQLIKIIEKNCALQPISSLTKPNSYERRYFLN